MAARVSHSTGLRALQRCAPNIAIRHLFEVAAVRAGARRCARVVVPMTCLPQVTQALGALDLHSGRPSVWNAELRRDGDDRFCRRLPISADTPPNATVSVMVAANWLDANVAQRVDDHGPAYECGEWLGYPSCCIAAYARIENGMDWLRSILEGIAGGELALPWACNAIEALFSQRSLHPDFFPCRLGCTHARSVVQSMLQAGVACGLDNEHAEGWHAMHGRVAVLDGAAVRLGTDGSAITVVLRPGRDARWRQVLGGLGHRIESMNGGLLLRTPRETLRLAGTLVDFR
jgi:hypothetical protein